MPYINVDVDLDDIYDDLSSFEKNQLIKWLDNDGYLPEPESPEDEFHIVDKNILDEFWVEMIKKLYHSRLQISSEDEEIIKQIVNKL